TNFSGVISVFFQDSGNAHSYVVPVTLTGDSAWHQVTVQNITGLSNQTINTTYGAATLSAGFTLLSGSTFQTGTTGSWVAGNFVAANTQGNFFASSSNFLKIAQVMLNPGATSVPYYSEPLPAQLLKCQRYYCKSYDFATKRGAVTSAGAVSLPVITTVFAEGSVKFPVTMRATATADILSPIGGSAIFDVIAAANRTVSSAAYSNNGINSITITGTTFTAATSGYTNSCRFHYIADSDY